MLPITQVLIDNSILGVLLSGLLSILFYFITERVAKDLKKQLSEFKVRFNQADEQKEELISDGEVKQAGMILEVTNAKQELRRVGYEKDEEIKVNDSK